MTLNINSFLSWIIPWTGGMFTMYYLLQGNYALPVIIAITTAIVDGIFVKRV